MRAVLTIAFAVLALPALAGEPYKPLPLQPAELVTPSEALLASARSFLAAILSGDGDAIKAGMASKVVGIDGALNLDVRRRSETIGPSDEVEPMLIQLAPFIGGDYERPEGVDWTPFAIEATREYIRNALMDPSQWGKDPMVKNGVCTYAYRSFDQKAIAALGKQIDVETSSFFYVDAPTPLFVGADDKGPVAMMLKPDLLYGLDYDTDAPRRWIAVHMPDGGSGFINFDKVELQKPYAAGICFTEAKDGKWLMSAQVSTSL